MGSAPAASVIRGRGRGDREGERDGDVSVAAKPPRLSGGGVVPSPGFWLRAGLKGRRLSGDSDITDECIALCANFVWY